MTLPLSPDLTAVDTGALPAATVNRLQDAVVARLHGDLEIAIPAAEFSDNDRTGLWDGATDQWFWSAAGQVFRALPFPPGTILLSGTFSGAGGGTSANLRGVLRYTTLSTGALTSGDAANSTTSATAQTVAFAATGSIALPHTMVTGRAYFIQMLPVSPGGGDTPRLYGASFTIRKTA